MSQLGLNQLGHTVFPLANSFKRLEDDPKDRDVVRFSVSVQTTVGEFTSLGWRFFPATIAADDTVYKPVFRVGQKSYAAVSCTDDFQTLIRAQARSWWDLRNHSIDTVAVFERLKTLYLQLGSWNEVEIELDKSLKVHGGPENPTQAGLVIAVRLLGLGLSLGEQRGAGHQAGHQV